MREPADPILSIHQHTALMRARLAPEDEMIELPITCNEVWLLRAGWIVAKLHRRAIDAEQPPAPPRLVWFVQLPDGVVETEHPTYGAAARAAVGAIGGAEVRSQESGVSEKARSWD